MKKVGIITLPGNFNYGNRLQCYAMVEAVRDVGCKPCALEREKRFPLCRRAYYRSKQAALSLAGKASEPGAEQMSTANRISAFKRFGARIPTEVIPGQGFTAGKVFDFLVIGSDQVWNPNEIAHQEKWYFAAFAQPEQRVAVSASLGIDDFADARQARRIAQGVKGFARVSVRERRGAELVRECSGREVEVICDPTLVLSAGKWRSVADGRLTPTESYVFTYLLGGEGGEAADVLERVTDHGRVPVIPLSDRQKPGEPDAGPAEFVDLIDNAAHVVTDSFHAAVFSSILQTPLTIVHREGGASMFSRLEGLADMIGIEHKIYGSDTYDLSRAGDYDGVPEAIDRERAKFMAYLEDCLDAQLPGWQDEVLA